MIVYLAGYKTIEKIYPDDPNDIYLLSSFWEHRTGNYGEYVRSEKHILDSGAYTAIANPGRVKSIDWNQYADQYADFIIDTNQRFYFELDIDSIIGTEAVELLRGRIETRTNRPSIPVWHKSRGIAEWHRLTEQYDYVAIGGFVTKEIPANQFKYIIGLLKIAEQNNAKVHGLGFTSTDWLRRLKFYSVDSGTWLVGSRFGNLCKMFPNGNMRQKYSDREGTWVLDRPGLEIYNFNVWVKFQKWAITNL